MKLKLAATLIAAAAVSACAQSPGSIAPVPMGNAYADLSCRNAHATMMQEKTTLAVLESKQRGAAAGDALGVALIGLPISSMAGNDVGGEIAATKGKVQALELRLARC